MKVVVERAKRYFIRVPMKRFLVAPSMHECLNSLPWPFSGLSSIDRMTPFCRTNGTYRFYTVCSGAFVIPKVACQP